MKIGLLGKVIYCEDDKWPFSYVYFDGKEKRWQKRIYSKRQDLFKKTREGLTEEKLRHNSVSLDELYSIFNQNHPADFKGHSMSVSDVVIVNRDGDMKAYYVDSFGFADLPDFVRQRQEALGIESPESHLDVGKTSSCISFYVAECSEFPVLGEFHQDLTLEQAFELFDQIPGSRMNGIKSIGFNLQDGSDYEGMFDLYVGRTLQKDIINSIPGYRDNKLVQKAISDAEKIIEKRQAEKEKPDIKKPKKSQKEKKTRKDIQITRI